MGATETPQQIEHRIRNRDLEGRGQPRRQRDAERIAIAACVLNGNQPLLARDRNL